MEPVVKTEEQPVSPKENLKEGPSSKLTSITKRLIAGGIFSVTIIVSIGWAFSNIEARDALIVISSAITGGFALLRL